MNEFVTLQPLGAGAAVQVPEFPKNIPVTIQEVVETETEIIFLGIPQDDVDETVHNCDQMGCGQCHVMYRFNKG